MSSICLATSPSVVGKWKTSFSVFSSLQFFQLEGAGFSSPTASPVALLGVGRTIFSTVQRRSMIQNLQKWNDSCFGCSRTIWNWWQPRINMVVFHLLHIIPIICYKDTDIIYDYSKCWKAGGFSEQWGKQFWLLTILWIGLQPCSKCLFLYFFFQINLFHKYHVNFLICLVQFWLKVSGGNADLVLANHLPVFLKFVPITRGHSVMCRGLLEVTRLKQCFILEGHFYSEVERIR